MESINLKKEKKEDVKMKKIGMDKVDKEVLLELVTTSELELVIPSKVTVKKFNTGSIERKNQEPMAWANLEVSDSEELRVLSELGYEDNVGITRIKIANYSSEPLDYLVGKEVSTEGMEIVFHEKKVGNRTDIDSLAFRSELKDIKVVS